MPLPAIAWGAVTVATWLPRLELAAKVAGYAATAYELGSAVYDWASSDPGSAAAPTPGGGGGAAGGLLALVEYISNDQIPGLDAMLDHMLTGFGTPGSGNVPSGSLSLATMVSYFEGIQDFNLTHFLRLMHISQGIAEMGVYTLDQAGLDAFDLDVTNGLITGDGLVVSYDTGQAFVPRLNPHFILYEHGGNLFNVLEILRMLTSDTHYHPTF